MEGAQVRSAALRSAEFVSGPEVHSRGGIYDDLASVLQVPKSRLNPRCFSFKNLRNLFRGERRVGFDGQQNFAVDTLVSPRVECCPDGHGRRDADVSRVRGYETERTIQSLCYAFHRKFLRRCALTRPRDSRSAALLFADHCWPAKPVPRSICPRFAHNYLFLDAAVSR